MHTISATLPEYGIESMGLDRIGPYIRRQYDSCNTHQWVRELIQNAIEASATRIQFEPEWEAVRELGVYRLKAWDNGIGMDADQLKQYMNNLSSGSKHIDGKHDNFGIGLRISTLPWNPKGMVVISVKDGYASMVVLKHDAEKDSYGVEKFPTEDGIETVVEPGEYNGIDYWKAIPEEIRGSGHGTVVILLGSVDAPHTVFGDPARAESGKQGIQTYVKHRYFTLPEGFSVRILRAERHGGPEDLSGWPTTPEDVNTEYRAGLKKGQWDEVRSLDGWLEMGRKKNPTTGTLDSLVGASGTVSLLDSDGLVPATLHWFMAPFDLERAPGDVDPGYLAFRYKGELYARATAGVGSVAAFKDFGIYSSSVRKRLWFVIEPQVSDLADPANPVWGVQPDDARSALEIVRGGDKQGVAELRAEWGRDFMSKMPEEIREAQAAESRGTEGLDLTRLVKLRERFGKRWQSTRVMIGPRGSAVCDPDTFTTEGSDEREGTTRVGTTKDRRRSVRRKVTPPSSGTGGGAPAAGPEGADPKSGPESPDGAGSHKGTGRKEASDLPHIEWKPAVEFADNVPTGVSPKTVAGSVPCLPGKDPAYPHGYIRLNEEHPIIVESIAEWVDRCRDRDPDEVRRTVMDIYATVAVAKVAHGFMFRAELDEDQRRTMFSPEAITLALAGIYPEEPTIEAAIRKLPMAAPRAA